MIDWISWKATICLQTLRIELWTDVAPKADPFDRDGLVFICYNGKQGLSFLVSRLM
jgi:hypothetical protein